MAQRLIEFEFSAAKPKRQIPLTAEDVDEQGWSYANSES